MQPDTMPSASPACTIIVPKYERVDDPVEGRVEGDALVRPQRGVLVRRTPRAAGWWPGRRRRPATMSTPSCAALPRIDVLVAEEGEPGDPAREHLVGGERGCAPRRPRAARCACDASRARSTRSCSNISGVTAPSAALDPVADDRAEVAAASLDERHGGPDLARRTSAVMRPSHASRGRSPSPWCRRSVATTGSRMSRPAMSRSTCGESAKPPLSTTPESDGQRRRLVREQHAEERRRRGRRAR